MTIATIEAGGRREGARVRQAVRMTPSLFTSVPTIDEVLHDHASELGHDFIAYRNHAYRVVNLCAHRRRICPRIVGAVHEFTDQGRPNWFPACLTGFTL